MDWHISKRAAVISAGVAVVFLLGAVLAWWATGGFGSGTGTTPGAEPPSSSSPSPSGSPSETKPGATPTESTEPVVVSPTVAELRKHLAGILRSTPYGSNENRKGTLTCDGSGRATEGTALRCEWKGVFSGSGGAPNSYVDQIYVAVLDDTGRYTFQMHGVDPASYPKGTIDCRTLMQSPPGSYPEGNGLGYSKLLYYWMDSGSPSSMDDDGNGLPCETVYPANEVARVAGSPVVPGNTPGVGHTIEDVRAHLEAVLTGPTALILSEARNPDGTKTDTGSAAVTGTTFTARQELVQGGVQVTVLDDDARYSYSYPRCCGWGPNVSDYPDDATCKQLSQPPTRAEERITEGLPYPFVVYYWMTHGSPDRLDKDGNGKPCEAQYSGAAVKSYFGSKLQP